MRPQASDTAARRSEGSWCTDIDGGWPMGYLKSSSHTRRLHEYGRRTRGERTWHLPGIEAEWTGRIPQSGRLPDDDPPLRGEGSLRYRGEPEPVEGVRFLTNMGMTDYDDDIGLRITPCGRRVVKEVDPDSSG